MVAEKEWMRYIEPMNYSSPPYNMYNFHMERVAAETPEVDDARPGDVVPEDLGELHGSLRDGHADSAGAGEEA